MTTIAPPAPATHGHTVLGYAPMDDIHEEFESLVRGAQLCTDAELPSRIVLLKAHLQSHFDAEDRWMRETEFPARECHIDEHAAVLASADEVCRLVLSGNLAVGRAFVNELEKWFSGHAAYLDSALAAWMCKLRFGGKPLVLRPKL
jgi:hemerythrin